MQTSTLRVERRQVAILAADVVGYSRLVERDERGTLERLSPCGESWSSRHWPSIAAGSSS